jgi:hypothetical protein
MSNGSLFSFWQLKEQDSLSTVAVRLAKLEEEMQLLLITIQEFQKASSERIFNMGMYRLWLGVLGCLLLVFVKHMCPYFRPCQMVVTDCWFFPVLTYMPQDFRSVLFKQQRERSERRRQAEVDALVAAGGSIHDKYLLLWRQQMDRCFLIAINLQWLALKSLDENGMLMLSSEAFVLGFRSRARAICYSDLHVNDRRHQLAQLGSSTGVLRTIVKWLVGVPQVLIHQPRLASYLWKFLEWKIGSGRSFLL